MQETLKLLKLTLTGGAIFLIPLVLVVVLLGKAFQIVKVAAEPLGKTSCRSTPSWGSPSSMSSRSC